MLGGGADVTEPLSPAGAVEPAPPPSRLRWPRRILDLRNDMLYAAKQNNAMRGTLRVGVAETLVHALDELKADGIGIFMISHDIHDVFDLADPVPSEETARSSILPPPPRKRSTRYRR